MERIEIGFPRRPLAQAKSERHLIEAAGSETAVKMPQPWNDHPDDGDLDVRTCLVEDKKIEPEALDELDAG
jgi:hypothetical protein